MAAHSGGVEPVSGPDIRSGRDAFPSVPGPAEQPLLPDAPDKGADENGRVGLGSVSDHLDWRGVSFQSARKVLCHIDFGAMLLTVEKR